MSKELPDISELRASQAKGATGKGTAERTLNECLAEFNQGTGIPVAESKEEY
jgi:hypothetical protein